VENSKLSSVFFWRALIYLFLTTLLSFFAANLFVNEVYYSQTTVFLLLSILLLGQTLVSMLEIKAAGLLAFLMADLFFTMIVVRATGGSASPFVVMFPIVTLAASFSFRPRGIVVLVASAGLVLMGLGVGFTVAIMGNALAIAATTLLGRYLVEALDASGVKLQKSESARRRLEDLQKAILANIPSGLMSVDSSGHIMQVNQVGLRILGLSEDAVLRHAVSYLLPSIDAELLKLSTAIPVLHSESVPERHTLSYVRPDTREEAKLGYTVVRLTDPDDHQVLGSLVVFQDLTVVTRLEEDLRRSEKLAAVGKLAAGIAHEIRNPLASISGSAQLLQSTSEMNEENASLLAIIARESFRLDGLITEFLDFVKPERVKSESVDLGQLMGRLAESLLVNPKWTSLGAQIEIAPQTDDGTVIGDAAKLEQVLLNLILNAGQAQARRVRVEWLSEGGFRVIDDGVGIPEALRSQIFEPFFTTKATGTGLGLSVTHRLVEAMGGQITVISPARDFSPDRGTIFEVRLKKQH
jgi:two-component system sensor histidine kinase PilS (NtrC family)